MNHGHCPYRILQICLDHTFQYHQAYKIDFCIVFCTNRIKIHGVKLFDKHSYFSEYFFKDFDN
jgi:hypothetical protein